MDLVLPLIILVARIVETTMETIRLVYVTKGHRYLASGIGTLKIGVWVISTSLVLTNLDNVPGHPCLHARVWHRDTSRHDD